MKQYEILRDMIISTDNLDMFIYRYTSNADYIEEYYMPNTVEDIEVFLELAPQYKEQVYKNLRGIPESAKILRMDEYCRLIEVDIDVFFRDVYNRMVDNKEVYEDMVGAIPKDHEHYAEFMLKLILGDIYG